MYNTTYYWEMQNNKGNIINQFNDKGEEQSRKLLDPDTVVRISFIPQTNVLPRHDCIIDVSKGDRFLRTFGRAFIKQSKEGINLKGYLYCIVTNKYRMYVLWDGRVIITQPDYELYIKG